MKEVIGQLLEGNFEYENGSLDFSCTKLELNIRPGEVVEGSFRILGNSGRYTYGTVLSSDSRMQCLTSDFVGTEEEIAYCFHGEELEEGEVIKGEFFVISNQGEYYLPFVVSAAYTVLESGLGNIKNLFHFTNLAKANPGEAVSLFYSKDFKSILNGSDRQYYEYYMGLSAYPKNEQNVEEFLIGINKKQKIEYLVDVSELRLEDPEGVVENHITITRNGWGYTKLMVETEGSFLYVEKDILTDDDFLGNAVRLPVYVEEGLVHDGNNYGAVRIYNSYTDIRIPVNVKYHGMGNRGRKRMEKKHRLLQLMEFYQAFRLKKISASTWLKESVALVEKIIATDERDVSARLFQAQLLITEERFNEAQWILDHVADMLDDMPETKPVEEAYYLYLTSLIHRGEGYVNQVTEQVENIYKRNRNEWRIAWLLLYLSEEYNRSFAKKWMFLEEQFNRGCTSPVIYVEALLLLNLNPTLLRKLGNFEKQLLLYGAKQEILSSDVILQFVTLMQREREFSPILYRILKACYQIRPDTAVLQEICSMLVKGNKTGQAYYQWYKHGVEEGLRITRLYEHFMMSVDVNSPEPLPKIVLMYFSYQNNLSYELAAYLYANIHKNKDVFQELYENYRDSIERFVTEQILKRRINRDLAYLYKNVLVPRMINEEVAEALSEIIFVNQIQINRQDIRYVVVYEYGRKSEKSYPVIDAKAYVSLPGADSRLLFEDGSHNRYMVSVPHTIEKLMLPGKVVKMIAPMVTGSRDFNVYFCTNGKELVDITPENEKHFAYLLTDEQTDDSMRREISLRLMRYYYEQDKIRELDEFLTDIAPDLLHRKERNEVLYYLVIRGFDEKAYEWLRLYGPYGVEPKTLVRLCSGVIKSNDYMDDTVLTEAVWYAFKGGKYDEPTLRYLTLYYKGLTKELRDIYKAAEAFSVDTYKLCEKMLIQMLFSGAFVGEKMDIFKTYLSGGAKADVEVAFLSQCAYEYFVKDRLTSGEIFEEMAQLHQNGEKLHPVCKLAFVKYYAENKGDITQSIKGILKQFIGRMLQEHVYLKMFTEFADIKDIHLDMLSEKTIVEYKAYPGHRAVMHYCVETADGEETEYLTEDMTEVYGGVCFKDFVLFFGERLQYYIMEADGEEEQLTESATIQKSDTGGSLRDGKFNLINDLSISNTLQDYETVDKLLGEYEYKEFMKNNLFVLI